MTQEDKELLLKDLSARLPYGVKVQTPYSDAFLIGIIDRKGYKKDERYIDAITDRQTYPIRYVKPYLRPMSSMTEKERFEYLNACGNEMDNALSSPRYSGIDWLNAHHFDYRGLIEKGLALEAPEGMYNIKEK